MPSAALMTDASVPSAVNASAASPRRCAGGRRRPAGVLLLVLLVPLAGCGGSRKALVAEQRSTIEALRTEVAALRTERDSLQAALRETRTRVDTLTVYVEHSQAEVAVAVAAGIAARADSLRHQHVLQFVRGQEKAGQLRGETVDVIYFTSGGTALTAEAAERLNRVAARLRRLPATTRILVEGHTDDTPFATAGQQNNRTLSAERAAVVKQYLVERSGLAADRFEAAGFGADLPLFSNDDGTARRFNRRVRIAVLER